MINCDDYFVNYNFTKVHTDNWFALSVNHYFGRMLKTVKKLLNTLHLMSLILSIASHLKSLYLIILPNYVYEFIVCGTLA